jgi:radical SAM protein with 4Fe4S-binding SPASM domain
MAKPLTEQVLRLGRIQRPPNLRVLGQRADDKVVLLDPDTPNWAAVSPAVAAFISLFDGQADGREMKLPFRVEGSKSATAADYTDLIAALLDIGMLRDTAQTTSPPISYTHPRGELEAVTLYLTNRCNLHCRYCFYDAGIATYQELKTDEWAKVIDELAQMKVRRLYIMGGEPLLRQDIFDLARRAKQKGLEVSLITNGTLIDPRVARQVHDAFTGIQVSLDGLRPEHELIRGPGSFDRAWQGIQTLLDIGAPVTVSCIVSRVNIEQLDDFVAFLSAHGVPRFHCVNLQTHGRGRDYANMAISFGQFASKLYHLHRRFSDQITIGQFDAMINVKPFRRKESCGVGRATLEIDANGNIYPCYKFMGPDHVLGNARTTGVAEVYQHSAQLQRLCNADINVTPECSVCDVRYFCGGGCLLDRLNGEQHTMCAEIRSFWRWALVHTDGERVTGQDLIL